MSKRQVTLILISIVLAMIVFLWCVIGWKSTAQGAVFSVLLGLMTMVCFNWWARPVYHNIYDYFSPLAVIQSLSFIYMGAGNILAFIYHDTMATRYGNPGADNYYNIVLFSSVAGLMLFDFAYRITSGLLRERQKSHPLNQLGLETLSAFRNKVIAVTWYIISFVVFAYMSSKYVKFGSAFRNVSGELDNILSQAGPGFFYAAWGALSILLITSRSIRARILYSMAMVSLLPVLFSYFSRTMALFAVVISCIGYLSVYPGRKISFKLKVTGVFLLITAFLALTGVKTAFYGDSMVQEAMTGQRGLAQRFVAVLSSDEFFNFSAIQDYAGKDAVYRLAALEYPAAIEKAHTEKGIPYMLGHHNLVALGKAVPRVLWPGKPVEDPEGVVNNHFQLFNLNDQMATIIGSAYADGGIPGVLLGLPLLAVVLCIIQHWIWRFKEGLIMYLGGFGHIVHYEYYLFSYPVMWLRFLVIMVAVNFAVRLMLQMVGSVPGKRRLKNQPPGSNHLTGG